jgi:hypothetical protein
LGGVYGSKPARAKKGVATKKIRLLRAWLKNGRLIRTIKISGAKRAIALNISSERPRRCLRTLEPSKGGIGTKLKTIRPAFRVIPVSITLWAFGARYPVFSSARPISANARHWTRFIAGPASVIKMSSTLRVRGLAKSTCTGFPQPIIPKGKMPKIPMAGMRIVPIGSA